MNRRNALKLMLAATLAGCSRSPVPIRALRVTVAGAGIVGASIAYHLAKAGALVTVIDKQGPASHASRGTFAWINATWAKQPRSYHALNQESVTSWRTLQQSLGIPIHWGGSLEWFDDPQRQIKLGAQISEQFDWGEPAHMIGPDELSKLEPNVNFGEADQVAFSGNDGAVDPVLATETMLKAAENMGAVIKFPCELTGVSLSTGALEGVETSCGSIQADKLVLATGAAPGTSQKFADSNVPQRSTPGIIVVTEPVPRLINRVIAAPGVHMHQRTDGRFVIGEQQGAPQNEAHALRLNGRPNNFPLTEIASQHAERMLTIAKTFAPGIEGANVSDVYIGWRPLPIDGHPVIGRSPARPDVYVAVMHSGVSLAPVVGQLVAHELIEGSTIDRLDEFRPGREFAAIKRY